MSVFPSLLGDAGVWTLTPCLVLGPSCGHVQSERTLKCSRNPQKAGAGKVRNTNNHTCCVSNLSPVCVCECVHVCVCLMGTGLRTLLRRHVWNAFRENGTRWLWGCRYAPLSLIALDLDWFRFGWPMAAWRGAMSDTHTQSAMTWRDDLPGQAGGLWGVLYCVSRCFVYISTDTKEVNEASPNETRLVLLYFVIQLINPMFLSGFFTDWCNHQNEVLQAQENHVHKLRVTNTGPWGPPSCMFQIFLCFSTPDLNQ